MAEPVKVVHLITLLEFGGAQGNTIHTVQSLDPTKYEAHLWSGRGAYWDPHVPKAIPPSRLKFFRSLVRPLNPFWDAVAVVALYFALRKLNPTILHTHSSKAGVLGRIAGKLARIPIILHTYHGFGFNEQQNWLTRMNYLTAERFTARFAQKLIFVSKANWETARELGIGNSAQYELIRSGVHLKLLAATYGKNPRTEFKIPESAPIVLTIGAFKPQKNLGDFLKMASIVKEQRPDVVFVVLGDGELREGLEKSAAELGLTDNLRLPGWRQDAPAFISASDVFVLTSLWEGLPRALVEAMALGISSVCYETDGVADVLRLGEGTMVAQGDVEGLAKRVLELLNNKELRRQLGGTLKARIGQDFDIDRMVRQQEDLYRRLLDVDKPHRKH